jgi:hypothetical protein
MANDAIAIMEGEPFKSIRPISLIAIVFALILATYNLSVSLYTNASWVLTAYDTICHIGSVYAAYWRFHYWAKWECLYEKFYAIVGKAAPERGKIFYVANPPKALEDANPKSLGLYMVMLNDAIGRISIACLVLPCFALARRLF